MTTASVRDWLATIGLEQYAELFEQNRIGVDVLPHLSDQDLRELGIPLGDRRRLLVAVKPEPSRPATPPRPAENLAPQAERRQLTVLFCDLVGSTALAQKLDPEDLRELMQAYQHACADAIERYEGTIAQYLGDGVMAYFGWPRAHEDDAHRAVRASREMIGAIRALRAPVELAGRIGIATGSVVVGDTRGDRRADAGLAVGETPNLAARIQGVAGINGVLIDEATSRLVSGGFDLERLPAQTLKGVDAPVTLCRVEAEAAELDRFEARAAGGLTPLVGREHEIELVLERWAQVRDGEGQVVLISGEPGIGKSRITLAVRERVASHSHVELRYQCSPYHPNAAFYPLLAWLERAAGFEPEDAGESKLRKLEAVLAQATHDVITAAHLIGTMMLLPTECYPPLDLSPQRQRELTVEALTHQVIGLSGRQPVFVVFEDVHWIDPSTLEVVTSIIDRLQTASAMLLITYRPEFDPPWIHYGYVTTIALNRLSRRQGSAMVSLVTGSKMLPDEVLDQIVSKTDGVPLFVEELTKTVLEAGILRDAGDRYELLGPLPPLAIPSTLHASLIARLDRLSPVKEVAQLGACIGREFSYQLLAAVSPLRDDELQRALRQLVDSGLILTRGAPPASVYVFKHALVQDASYGSLLKSKRHQLHAALADALQNQFSGIADSEPALVAHHLTEAGHIDAAIEYWARAGRIAAERSNNPEAIAYLNRALELLARLPEPARTPEQELRLLNMLAAPLMNTKGYAAAEAGKVYRRVQELCGSIGAGEPVYQALSGLCQYHMVVGDQNLALGISEQTLTLASTQDSLGPLLEANRLMELSLLWTGRLRGSIEHSYKVQELFDPVRRQQLALTYGQDHLMSSLAMNAIPLTLFGLPDQAVRSSTAAIEEARRANHAYSYAYAIATPEFVFAMLRDMSRLQASVDEAVSFCTKQSIAFMLTYSLVHRGLVIVESGDLDAGIEQMREGLGRYQSIGCGLFVPYYKTLLAQALLKKQDCDAAASVLAEADEQMERWGELFFAAETARVRGDLALTRSRHDPAGAESWYRKAIQVACRQEAKLLELRAAVSLARLWAERGRRRKAYELLAPIHAWFTEGFEARDLQDGKALLEQLKD